MKTRLLLLLAAGLFAAFTDSACAQDVTQRVGVCDPTPYSAHYCAKPDASGNLPVTGTFSATLAGFTPNGNVANLNTSTSTGNVALPAGLVVAVTNDGADDTSIKLTVGASTAATTDWKLKSGATTCLTVGSNTFINAINATTTSHLSLAGGAGLCAGYGGGGSGGGGGGAVTIADGASVTLGAKADAKSTATDTTPITEMQVLKQISASVQAPPSQAVTNAGTFAAQLTGATNNINNVSGTVSLPTGASTSALQPTNAAAASTTSGQTGNMVLCAVTTSAPTYTNAQSNFCNMDTSGNIRVTATGSGGTSVAQGSTTSGQNVSPMGCRTLTAAPTDTTAQTNMPRCLTDGSVAVTVVSATGVAQGSTSSGQTISPVGCRTLTSAPTDTTAQTNMPWCTTKGSQVVAQPTAADLNATIVGTGTLAVQAAPTASTAGGVTKATVTAANSTNATNLKASAGALYHISVYNNSATLAWVSLYNTAGTPTCGTSIVWQTMIPANSTSGAGAVEDFAVPLDFATGIGYCITTGIAGTGSVAASAYVVNFGYK